MSKESKMFVLKNLIAFGMLFFIVFSVICYNIPIGFTVFENIEKTPLFIVISSIILILIVIIIIIIVLIFVKKIKNNKKESDKNG